MSIAKLRKKMRQKGLRMIFWGAMLVVFLISCFLGYGSLSGRRRGMVRSRDLPPAVVAKVGRKKITREDYNKLVEQQFESYSRFGPLQLSTQTPMKKNVLDAMIDRIVKRAACRKARLRVSGREVDDKIDNLVDQQLQSMRMQAGSARRFALQVKRKFGSLSKLKQKLRTELDKDRDNIAEQVLFDKLEKKVKNEVKVTLADYRRSTEQVHARHILIKPDKFKQELKNKAKGDKLDETQLDKEADAKARKKAEDLLDQLKAGASFEELAKKYSDDYGSAAQGGDLGWFGRGQMVKPFEEAAFRLKKGELSGVVKSSFGYHIIKVEGKRLNLPPDYNEVTYKCEECGHEWTTKDRPEECPKCKAKKFKTVRKRREELLDHYRQRKQDEHWREYVKRITDAAHVEIIDPELKAYELELKGKNKEAIKLYKQALKYAYNDPWIKAASLNFRIAQLYQREGDDKQAIEYYRAANDAEEDAEVHLALAKLYMKNKDKTSKQQAVDELKQASEMAYDTPYRHQEIKQLFEQLGEKELAAKEQKLLDEAKQNRGGFF